MSDEEMSEADLKAEVEHNQWAQDMAVEEAVNAVKPELSPVCVEVKGNSQTFEQWWLHHVMPDGQRPYEWAPSVGIGVIAERAFNAGRRTLELVNARSVESVKAEERRWVATCLEEQSKRYDAAVDNATSKRGRERLERLSHRFRCVGEAIAGGFPDDTVFPRSLTEGEG